MDGRNKLLARIRFRSDTPSRQLTLMPRLQGGVTHTLMSTTMTILR